MKKTSKNLLSFAKDSTYLLTANLFSILFGVLTTIFLSRYLSAFEYGRYRYVISFLALFTVFSLPGMRTSITQGTARGLEYIFKRSLFTRLKWSLLSTLIGVLLSLFYFFRDDKSLAFAFFILALLCPLYFSLNGFLSYLQGKMRFQEILKSEFTLYSAQSIITILAAVLTKDFRAVVFCYIFTYSVTITFLSLKYLRELPADKSSVSASAEEQSLIRFGKYLSLVKLINVFRAQYDKIFTGIYLGFYTLAIYSVAAIFSEQFKIINMVINSALLPRLSVLPKDDSYKKVKKYLIYYSILVALIGIAIIVVIPYILPLLFSSKYAESVRYAQMLMASMIIASPVVLISTLFESQKEKKLIWYLNNTCAAFDILCISIFLPLYGITGIITARFVSRISGTIFALYLLSLGHSSEKKHQSPAENA